MGGGTVRVVFLDVDGVLNYVYTKEFAPSGCIGVANEPLEALAELVKRTEAKVVLTSTWKRGWALTPEFRSKDGQYLHDKLLSVGIEIYDKTTDQMFDRGRGIYEWLDRHPKVTNWVVLDDDIFEDYKTYGVMPHIVQTSFVSGGFKQKHIPRCVKMLTKENTDGNKD